MGCWYRTCGLSGLPILPDMPIIAMIIVNTDVNKNTPHSVFDNWQPASPILRGTYNDDHATIEFTDEHFSLLDLTRAKIINYSKGIHAIAPYPDDETGLIRMELNNDNYAWWIAHERVFDHLMQKGTAELRWDSANQTYFPKKSFAEYAKAFSDDIAVAFHRPASYYHGLDEYFEVQAKQSSLLGTMGSAAHALESLAQYYAFNGHDERDWILPHVGNIAALRHMMERLRITLAPTGACGSQDQDMDAHMIRDEAARQVFKAYEEEMESW